MWTRNMHLVVALAALAALLSPLSASALSRLPTVSGVIEAPDEVWMSFSNDTDPADRLDIVAIQLDGFASDVLINWDSVGNADEPRGVEVDFLGEGTPLLTMLFEDTGSTSRGFNGGEELELEEVETSSPGVDQIPIEDYAGVIATIIFENRSDPDPDNWFEIDVVGVFQLDPRDSDRVSFVTIVPEPGTAMLLGLGLSGLAVAVRRRS